MKNKAIWLLLFTVVLAIVGWLVWSSNRSTQIQRPKIVVLQTVEHLQEGGALTNPKPARRYKIGVLFPFLASPFWVNEAYGVLDQASKLGVDVVWLSADGYDNIDKQNGQIEDLVVRRVDAILLAATSATGTVPAVERAAALGVPVFAHVTSSNTDKVLSSVVDDDLSIGQQQAEFMGQATGGKGTVAMLDGPAAADWSSRRVQGFKQVLSSRYPGLKIVAERNGIPDRADAQRQTEDILSANRGLDGIFTVADGMAMGAADAVAAAGRSSSVTITTASFSRESLPYMAKGLIKLNVDENPVLMGRAAVNNVVTALSATPVPKTIYVPNPARTAQDALSIDPSKQWAPDGWTLK
jgi:ABC-type sugar transport system substrate-binding protein